MGFAEIPITVAVFNLITRRAKIFARRFRIKKDRLIRLSVGVNYEKNRRKKREKYSIYFVAFLFRFFYRMVV